MKLRIWFMAAIFVMMGTYAFAVQVAAPASAAPATGSLSDGSIWKGLLNGLLAGVIASVAGWLKNKDARTGAHESFDIKFVIPTAMIGAAVGVIASLMKKSPGDFVTSIENSPLYAAITLGVEYVMKIVWRHSVFHLKDVLGDIKTGAGNPTPPAPPTQ